MKKKLFSVLLVGALAASLVACDSKKKDADKTPSTVNTEINADEYAATISANADVYKTFVSLPDWKGMSVDLAESDYIVEDSDIESYIQSLLEATSTTDVQTTGTTKSGDTIKLDYSGKLDGTAFSGGTATDASYTIGSGKFIDDLDKGLVGLTVGVETDIPCTFPESYQNSDLAGKQVVFTVTVKEIDVTVVPELTDEWVTENSSKLGVQDQTLSTVDDLRAYVKDYLNTQASSSRSSEVFDTAYSQMTDGLDVSDYPSEELSDLLKTLNSNVDAEYESYSSSYSSKEQYLKSVYNFDSLDAFNDYADSYAKQYLFTENDYYNDCCLIIILQLKQMKLIQQEKNLLHIMDIMIIRKSLILMEEKFASYYGYNDYQEILDTYGREMNSEIGYQVLYQKVVEFVCDNVTVNDTSSTAE
ncbi:MULTISPECIES: FKBP-type peptidyl-prolyl cis-trans isomerase [Clostridia]|uniref:FKBP-type peptidyl-prolyl cis-trans isomerase n=1 Tax=Clostridia TaxID=186801 RepID=UPI001314E403|nr:FKBP-type peptidyl-prolyl cis-trans isomerase [Eubacterium sp. AF22-9]